MMPIGELNRYRSFFFRGPLESAECAHPGETSQSSCPRSHRSLLLRRYSPSHPTKVQLSNRQPLFPAGQSLQTCQKQCADSIAEEKVSSRPLQ